MCSAVWIITWLWAGGLSTQSESLDWWLVWSAVQSGSLLCCKPDCTVNTAASLAAGRFRVNSCTIIKSASPWSGVLYLAYLFPSAAFLCSYKKSRGFLLVLHSSAQTSVSPVSCKNSCVLLSPTGWPRTRSLLHCSILTEVNLTSKNVPELEHNGQ